MTRVSSAGVAVSFRLRFLEIEPNHDPLRVSGMTCSETVSAGSSTRVYQEASRDNIDNGAHLLFNASCIDAICFSAVPGDTDLGSSGSAKTRESVVLARVSLV